MLQISSEDGRVQVVDDVVKEGGDSAGRGRVEAVKAHADEAIDVTVGSEGRRDSLGNLNGLAGRSETTNGDLIGVDNTAGSALVTVLDLPGSAGDQAGGAALGGSVDVLAVDLGRGGQAAEDPQVRRASVQVQVQDLGRGTDADGDGVGIIRRVDGASGDAAAGALG